MDSPDYVLAAETQKSFDQAVVSILKAVDKKGWTVFQIYDLKERMAAKGFEHKPLKILEVCSAKHSDKVLNKNRYASLCMPCRINVIGGATTVIAAMKPSVMPEFFPGIGREDVEEIEKDITEIVNNAR